MANEMQNPYDLIRSELAGLLLMLETSTQATFEDPTFTRSKEWKDGFNTCLTALLGTFAEHYLPLLEHRSQEWEKERNRGSFNARNN
jgi:hypothetical protein